MNPEIEVVYFDVPLGVFETFVIDIFGFSQIWKGGLADELEKERISYPFQ